MAVVADTRFRFAEAIERAQRGGPTPTLDRIDLYLYGTLELSSDEIPQFLGESAQLIAAAVNDQEREVLQAARRLSERCRADHSLPFGWSETERSGVIPHRSSLVSHVQDRLRSSCRRACARRHTAPA